MSFEESNKIAPEGGASEKDVSYISNNKKTDYLLMIVASKVYS